VCVPAAFEKPGVVDLHDAPMRPSEKMERMTQAGDDFRNGFSGDFRFLLACFA
jgi:hypothetical protein